MPNSPWSGALEYETDRAVRGGRRAGSPRRRSAGRWAAWERAPEQDLQRRAGAVAAKRRAEDPRRARRALRGEELRRYDLDAHVRPGAAASDRRRHPRL